LVYHGVTIDRVRQFYRTTMDDGASTFLKDELAKESPKIMNLIVHPYPLGDGAAEQEHDNNVGYSNIIQQAVFELGGTVYHIGMNQIDDLRKLTEAVGAAAGGVKSAREVKPETKANMVEIQQTIDNYDGSVVLHFVGESDPTIISEKMLKFHEVMKDRPVYLIDYQGTDVVRSHQHLMNQMDYLTDVLLKHPNVVHYIIAPAGIVVKDTAARGGVDSFEGELSVRVYLQAVAVGLNNLCVPVTVLDDRRLNEPSMFLGNLAWTIKARKRSVNLHVSQAEVGSYSAEPKFGPETPMSVRLAFDGVLVAHAAGVTDPDELQVLQSRLEKTIPNGRVMVVSYPCSDVQDDQQSFINLMENLSRSIIEGQMDMVNIVVPNKEVTMADVSAIGHAQALSKIINTAGVPAVIVIINDDVSDRKLEADVAFVIKQGKFVLQPTSREKSFGVLSLIAQGSGKQGERVMPDKSQGEPEVGRPGWYDRPAPALTPVDERLNPRTLGEVERREPDFSQAVVSFDGVVVLHTYSNGKLQLLSERVHVIRDTLQQARLYTLPYDGYASSEILDRVNENFHTGEPIWTEGKDGVKVAHVILFNGKLEPARISSPTTMVELELHHLLQGVHMHDRRAMFFDDEDFTSHEKLVEALNKVVEYAMEKSVQDPAAAEQAAQVAEAIGDARTEQANPGLQKFMENSANLEENIAGVIKQFLDSLPEEERSQLVGTMNDGILVSSALDRLINMGVIENRQ
jgi:hypothetical protein